MLNLAWIITVPEKYQNKIDEYEGELKQEVVDRELKETTPLDLARIDAYEAKRLRERTVEEIENFDINNPGLVVHGTYTHKLEGIIKAGLGREKSDNPEDATAHDLEVDLHVVGAKTIVLGERDLARTTQTGFRPGETVFNNENGIYYGVSLYLVSDIFKNLYPEVVDEILKSTAGRPITSNYEHIAVPTKGEEPRNAFRRGGVNYFHSEHNPRGFAVFPSDSSFFYVKFPEGGDEAELLARKLLSARSFNGIVIPEECKILSDLVIKQEDTLKQIVEIQERLLPREERIPCYSTDGKCIYNPLKSPATKWIISIN